VIAPGDGTTSDAWADGSIRTNYVLTYGGYPFYFTSAGEPPVSGIAMFNVAAFDVWAGTADT
jgi:hypothetical protein